MSYSLLITNLSYLEIQLPSISKTKIPFGHYLYDSLCYDGVFVLLYLLFIYLLPASVCRELIIDQN